ncbi:glycosyltransferase [Sphingomonas sp. RS2018]
MALLLPIRIANVPDVSPGDAFVDLPPIEGRDVEWLAHSGLPQNVIERRVRRPRLSRYRAAWQAAGEYGRADILISHLPRMTTAVEQFARLRGHRLPHLAFSFNFTDLPEGRTLARMTKALAGVERFCVYSKYETELYPRLFDLPPDRFRHVMWGQSAPSIDLSMAAPDAPYVVAIGGEGRDYASMIAAARTDPAVRWIVVARPNSVFDAVPANMTVHFNLPAPLTWGIAARAAAVVVPLVSDQTCCGHITIASAQLLGLPLVTTRSDATIEYLAGVPDTITVEPSDPSALAQAVRTAVARYMNRAVDSDAVRRVAEDRYDRSRWTDLIVDFVRDFT